MQDKFSEIAENIAAVRENIARAATEAHRRPEEITLVAATKTQTSDAIRAAIAAGISVCGENRVQELVSHLEDKAYAGAQVHFIGHLQTNKVKQVVGQVDMIQSVDSAHLMDAISAQAQKLGIVQDILLELNIGLEESKGGVTPEQLLPLAEHAASCPGVRLRGLMCIPPADATPEETNRFFAQTHQLFIDIQNKLSHNKVDIDCLSMGMSGDYPLAVAAGATSVRVGTALFGVRPPLNRH